MVIGDGPFLDRYIFQKRAYFFRQLILKRFNSNNEILDYNNIINGIRLIVLIVLIFQPAWYLEITNVYRLSNN